MKDTLSPQSSHELPELSVPFASFGQQGLWMAAELEGASAAYNESLAFNLDPRLSYFNMMEIVQSVVAQHEALRTTFELTSSGELLRYVSAEPRVEWQRIDLQETEDVEAVLAIAAQIPFDLKQGPLVRANYLQRNNGSSILQFITHHIVLDGWSRQILTRDLELAAASVLNDESRSPDAAESFSEFVRFEKATLSSQRLEADIHYWRDQLRDVKELLAFPYDKPRPPQRTFSGGCITNAIPSDLVGRLRSLSRANRVTLFSTLLAGFALVVSRYSGETDIPVGVPVANRSRTQDENVIGHFVNTVVIRNHIKQENSFWDIAKQVSKNIAGALEHSSLPFGKVVEAMRPVRSLGHNPIYQIGFEYHRDFGKAGAAPSFETMHPIYHTTGTAKNDFTLLVEDGRDGLILKLEYSTDLLIAATAKRIMESVLHALSAISMNSQLKVGQVPVLSDSDQRSVLLDWNNTFEAFPPPKPLYDYFEEKKGLRPKAVAVRCGAVELTYEQLDLQVELLALNLKSSGVEPGHRISLSLNRSISMIVSILAVLKCGAAFVPIDPQSPRKRAQKIVLDSGSVAVLVSCETKSVFDDVPVMVIQVDDLSLKTINCVPPPKVSHDVDDTAYIIYTSGTTGSPKGVAIRHRNIVNTLQDISMRYPVLEGDRYLFNLNYIFDASVIELFSWFFGDGALVILEPGLESSPDLLAEVIVREKITHIIFPTALLGPFIDEVKNDFTFSSQHSLKFVYVGGAALSSQTARRAYSALAPATLENHYGPTEAAILASTYTVTGNETEPTVPIGRPISNTKAYILNDMLEPTPIGVTGELYLGGAGVASGYINDPGLTAARFIPDPWETGQHLYRTGDHCKWLPDGNLSFTGRVDHQVKIRGMRVELGEIEQTLLAIPGIGQAVVIDVKSDDDGIRLAAFIVEAPRTDEAPEKTLSANSIIAQLKLTLPSHMVPMQVRVIESLPLTQSGKVDRKLLTEAAATSHEEVKSPSASGPSNTEESLCQIWSSVLRCTAKVNDNFFELGGDSILAIQVASRARRIGLTISARDIFRYQSIAELAAATSVTTPQKLVTQSEAEWCLLPIQRRFFDWALAKPNRFDQSVLVETPKDISHDFIFAWMDQLVCRHPALRTRFRCDSQSRTATIGSKDNSKASFRLEHLQSSPNDIGIKKALETSRSLLDIENGPLIVATIFQEGDEIAPILLLTCHHLAVDGVSWRIILDELRLAFEQWSDGKTIDLGIPPNLASDWVRLLEQFPNEQLIHERAYWLKQLHPEKTINTTTSVDRDETDILRFTHEFDSNTTRALLGVNCLNEELRTVDLVLAIALWSLGLCGVQGDISVALEGHGREADGTGLKVSDAFDLSQTVGWFTSYYPVALHIPDPCTADLQAFLVSMRQRISEIPSRGLSYDVLRYLYDDPVLRNQESIVKPYVLVNFLGDIEDTAPAFRRMDSRILVEADDAAPVHHVVEINGYIAKGKLVFRLALQSSLFPETEERFRTALSEAAWLIESILKYRSTDTQNLLDQPIHPELQNENAAPSQRTYPMTGLQRGLLFESMLNKDQSAYVNQLYFRIEQPFNRILFERAWSLLFSRHQALRTAFGALDQEVPLQIIYPEVCPEFYYLDFTNLTEEEAEAEFEVLRRTEKTCAFDFGVAPLMKFIIIECAADCYRFLWTSHHAILDGWSISILWRELEQIYLSLVSGEDQPLPKPASYKPYELWVASQDLCAAKAFWREDLVGFSGYQGKPYRSASTSVINNVRSTTTLSYETSAVVRAACRTFRITPATFFQAVWALTLHSFEGSHDVVFGTTVSGRIADIEGIENIVGLLISTIPSRIKLSLDERVSTWLQGIQTRHIEREHFSYLDLVEIQKCSAVSGRADLFRTLLVYENYPQNIFGENSTSAFACRFDEQTHFDLGLIIIPGDRFRLDIEFNPSSFSEKEVATMTDTITSTIAAISQASVETKLDTIIEREQVATRHPSCGLSLVTRQGDLPLGRQLVHELIEDWAEREPLRNAVTCGERSYTYEELNIAANRLAHILIQRGVRPDTCVGVHLHRDERLLISILAIWKAGAAYVPLDPALPQNRLHDMLGICEAEIVICDQNTNASFADNVQLDFDTALSDARAVSTNPNINVASSDLSYVLFTSGSTGLPKGAMVEHIGALNNILNKVRDFDIGKDSRVAQTASQSFDISIWQMFIGLTQGGQTIIFDDRTIKDIAKLWRDVGARKITTLQLVPTYLMLLVEHLDQLDPAKMSCSVTHLILTGEAADARHIKEWRNHFPEVIIVNAYGPTEASDDITHHIILPEEDVESPVPIGRVLSNFDIYIVDENLAPVAIGEKGEIVVTGVGIGRGYKNMPIQTQAAFLESPFSDRYRGRLYKTGDLGEMREDGLIYFHGRLDKQVKIRGYRIELEEVEHHLCQCSSVRQAVVVNISDNGEEAVLCAFIVPASAAVENNVVTELKQRVPDYMIPTEIRFVAILPELESGKIDRKTLKENFSRPETGQVNSPKNEVEKRLAAIWAEVLKLEIVDIQSSFFDLGGDSFKAIRIAAKFGEPLEVSDIYDFETVAAIAEVMKLRENKQPHVLAAVSGDLQRAAAIVVAVANSGGDPISFREVGVALEASSVPLVLTAIKLPRLPVADDEQALLEITRLTNQVCDEVQDLADLPVIVLAQCNGSALGISIARELAVRGTKVPAICIGGALIRDEITHPDTRTDSQILEFLGSIGSTLPTDPAEAAFFLHDFRYDSRFANVYYNQLLRDRSAGDLQSLETHLVCLVGTRDPLVEGYKHKFRGWSAIASSTSLVEYSGQGHYLLRDCPELVAQSLIETWEEVSSCVTKGGH